jgi:hypothetical protein
MAMDQLENNASAAEIRSIRVLWKIVQNSAINRSFAICCSLNRGEDGTFYEAHKITSL